jgi:hypothetical protein
VEEKKKLGTRAALLMEAGEKIKEHDDKGEPRNRAQKKKDKKEQLLFEQHFYFLKKVL